MGNFLKSFVAAYWDSVQSPSGPFPPAPQCANGCPPVDGTQKPWCSLRVLLASTVVGTGTKQRDGSDTDTKGHSPTYNILTPPPTFLHPSHM